MLLKDTGTVPECPTGKGYAHKKLSTKRATLFCVEQSEEKGLRSLLVARKGWAIEAQH